MMLLRNELDLIWNIAACRRCIRSARYSDAVAGSQHNRWAFTQNSFAALAIVLWCQVFGSHKEPTHYSRVFTTAASLPLSQSEAAVRLRTAGNMAEDEYKTFWQGVKDARDRFFVHNEFTAEARPVFPDAVRMIAVCLEMRNILVEILRLCQSAAPEVQQNMLHFISHYTNDVFMNEIAQDLPHLIKAANEN